MLARQIVELDVQAPRISYPQTNRRPGDVPSQIMRIVQVLAMFPSVDPDDVRALTGCIDWVVEHLA